MESGELFDTQANIVAVEFSPLSLPFIVPQTSDNLFTCVLG